MTGPVEYGAAADGTLIYRIRHAPSELPAVRGRDILAAWDGASDAAIAGARGARRRFQFCYPEGGVVSLAVTDRDARCWAAASDRLIGMHTSYGVSVFLRLLALIDLLARWPGLRGLRDVRRAIERNPLLLRLAAEACLTDEAGFDETGFRPLLPGGTVPDQPIGVSCP